MGDLSKLYIDAFEDVKNLTTEVMVKALKKIKRIFS